MRLRPPLKKPDCLVCEIAISSQSQFAISQYSQFSQSILQLWLKYRLEDKDVDKDERDKIRKQIKENTSNNPRLNTSRRKSQVLQALKSQANQLPPHFDKRNNF